MKNSINANKFFPVIITKKLAATKNFYIGILNCEEVFGSDWYIQLVSPKGLEIGLLVEGHKSQPDFLHQAYNGNGIVLSFEVENVDEEYKRAQASGFAIAYELKTEEWGQRHFMLRDPNCMVVDFVQHLEQ